MCDTYLYMGEILRQQRIGNCNLYLMEYEYPQKGTYGIGLIHRNYNPQKFFWATKGTFYTEEEALTAFSEIYHDEAKEYSSWLNTE